MKYLKKITNNNTTVYLREDAVIVVKPNVSFQGDTDLDQIKKTVRAVDELSSLVLKINLLVFLPDRNVTKSARDYLKNPEVRRLPDAVALIAKNKFQQILGNILVFFVSPVGRTRLFMCEQEAVHWFKDQKKPHEIGGDLKTA